LLLDSSEMLLYCVTNFRHSDGDHIAVGESQQLRQSVDLPLLQRPGIPTAGHGHPSLVQLPPFADGSPIDQPLYDALVGPREHSSRSQLSSRLHASIHRMSESFVVGHVGEFIVTNVPLPLLRSLSAYRVVAASSQRQHVGRVHFDHADVDAEHPVQ